MFSRRRGRLQELGRSVSVGGLDAGNISFPATAFSDLQGRAILKGAAAGGERKALLNLCRTRQHQSKQG